MSGGSALPKLLLVAACVKVAVRANDGGAVFIREFALSRRDHLPEENPPELGQRPEDPSSRTARSEEDRDTLWDAWGSWSECSRTCGGGASYSLRRCLSSKSCEGQNIKYRTCGNVDCPPEAGDFRAQQCSAHADVRFQGRFHEWLPVYNDPENPCSLKCSAKDSGLVLELAPKVLDGTRCYTESLDMCISGACQIVGCDHELGSAAKEDNCGVCGGDGATCRLVRGHYRAQQDSGRGEDTVVVIPYRSRHVRLVLKGPDHLYVESQTLQGVLGELDLDESGLHHLENTTLDFQKLSDKQILRIGGPLGADFTIKVRLASGADTTVQYLYYQPIGHRWRETDFFPCSVTCGGGYQLTSAECLDVRSGRVVVDQYCHYYPENVKPKPKLQECNPEPCLASDGYKQLTPYDLYHPLPRWESSPWTSCSASCGGGVQSRSVSCVEEDVQGVVMATEEWKCLYAPKTDVLQPCNTFGCPSWLAQDWSPCTVSCGPGLRYRVVLCMDHRGLHAGGCQPSTKPPIKEECLVAVPCYKPADTLPVEAKPAWHKQAIELGGEEQEEEEEQEEVVVSEEPTFLPGPWRTCSRTCGAGIQQRAVRCRVLLRFSQTVADLPDHECEGVKPAAGRPCYRAPCPHVTDQEGEELHDWEYDGFTECSQSCGGGTQEAVIVCLNKRTGEAADQNLCVSARRPPQLLQACRSQPCPPRWVTGEWTSCSATCGVGLMTRSVECVHQPGRDSNRTRVLRDQDCRNLKPSPVQACNRFDCPPMWDPQDWGQCSSSCGRGVQTRRVRCKQRMADGSNLELPDTFCPSHGPPSQQACSQQECPPTWVAAGWSQCSVTCGSGVQRLRTSCQNQGSEVDPENCFWIPPPPRTRPCSPRPCDHVVKSDRTILAQKKVYVQWRKAKKLHLVVGGHAYLLPWTTLLLRCPTRHFRKGRVRWLKDGKPLAGVPHVSVTALGHLKVQQVRPSDVGVYTCVAGSAHEHFVLQVLGSKRKVAPAPRPQEAGPDGTFGREFWASLNRYDAFVEQLLELRRSLPEDAAKPGGKNKGNPEDGGSEPPGLFVLIADTYRLDRLLSDGGLGGPRAPQLVAQLFRQLTAAHGDANESTLYPPDGAESSTPAPFLFKPRIKAQTSKSPLIIQRPPKFQPPSADMVVAVGAPVLLQRPFSSLELSCEVLGSPEPSVTWTRNGKKLQQNGRVALMSSGSLKIQSPNKLDEGLYTCTARNRLGSASLSSWLQIIGGRGRHCDPAGPNGTNACSERKNSSHSAAPCSGPRCHHRWQAEPWSPCSASCGGGSQTRSVRCLTGSEGVWSEGGGPACLGAGRKPADARLCNQLPCARWGATHWGPCQGECVGPSLATQQRHLYCQDANGTKVPSRMCGSLPRPGVLKNCSTQACVLEWRVGAWTPCTATCGRHGFQSRPVTCAHVRSGKVAKEHQCAWKPRPPSWQRCNVQSCGRAGECQDSTRYCEKVRQLELCSLPQFQNRCCRSCRNT